MADEGSGRLRVGVGVALWALAFALSLVLAFATEPAGSGFTRGMSRIGTFFRWQFLAFALAIFVWLSGRGRTGLSKGLGALSRVPIYIQCLLGLIGVVVAALAVILRLSGVVD